MPRNLFPRLGVGSGLHQGSLEPAFGGKERVRGSGWSVQPKGLVHWHHPISISSLSVCARLTRHSRVTARPPHHHHNHHPTTLFLFPPPLHPAPPPSDTSTVHSSKNQTTTNQRSRKHQLHKRMSQQQRPHQAQGHRQPSHTNAKTGVQSVDIPVPHIMEEANITRKDACSTASMPNLCSCQCSSTAAQVASRDLPVKCLRRIAVTLEISCSTWLVPQTMPTASETLAHTS